MAPVVRPRDGYVWQRVWTDDVREGVRAAASVLDGFRVNAASVGTASGWVAHTVDVNALAAAGRPVRAVVRIDADVVMDGSTVGAALTGLAERWRSAGVDVVGVEVDHDCATARLPAYSSALRAVRAQVPADLALSVTALPTWSSSPALDDVIAAVDEVVLQVHAVDPPTRGLFDPGRARDAVRAYAGRTEHLWVAAPAYGLRLATGVELRVDPAAVVGFVAALDPDEVDGVVWFRVPVRGDPRAWPLAAIAAADRGEVPHGRVVAEARPGPDGVFDLWLANDGLAWVPMPTRVTVRGACSLADALPPYALARDPSVAFVLAEDAPLDPVSPVPIGWVRCEATPGVELQ